MTAIIITTLVVVGKIIHSTTGMLGVESNPFDLVDKCPAPGQSACLG